MANKYTALEVPPKELLEHLYNELNLNQQEVGVHFNTSQKVVFSWFKKLGIKSRKPAKRFQSGDKNSSWKGDDVTYAALHKRVESLHGKPNKCETCGTKEAKRYEWANVTGDYNDIVNGYKRMCTKCHRGFDKNRKNSSKHVKRTSK